MNVKRQEMMLKIFFWAWSIIALLVNIVAILGVFLNNKFWDAILIVQSWYSPFNFMNMFLEILLFSPALGAYFLIERIKKRRRVQSYT